MERKEKVDGHIRTSLEEYREPRELQELPVYEAEIVEVEDEQEKQVEKFSYKLGKAAGSLIALLGFFRQVRGAFKAGAAPDEGCRGRMPRGRGRRKRRRR